MFIEVWIKKGVGKDLLFEEGLINFVFSQNSSPYERMDSDLIDSSGQTFCPVEDGLNGIVGKQPSRCLSPFKVKVDVADGIIEGKADLERAGRCVVTIDGSELARGGGGCRCMTMPLGREPL